MNNSLNVICEEKKKHKEHWRKRSSFILNLTQNTDTYVYRVKSNFPLSVKLNF